MDVNKSNFYVIHDALNSDPISLLDFKESLR